MKRKCAKCGKLRVCRKHHQGKKSCKSNTQALCLPCNAKQAKEWYEENRERKLAYQKEYYASKKRNSEKENN